MAQELPRAALQIERLYYCEPADAYFNTPDGVGVYWYESLAEALDEVGTFDKPIIRINQPLADY